VQETRYACNGLSIVGPAGATGAPATNAPEPEPIGKFLSTQLIRGAILDCEGVIKSSSATWCIGPTINGVTLVEWKIFSEQSGLQAMNALCKLIAGKNAEGYSVTSVDSNFSFFSFWTDNGWRFSQNLIPGQRKVAAVNCLSAL
jgi:hypothetical protein